MTSVIAASLFTDAFKIAHTVARMTGFQFHHLLVHTCVRDGYSCICAQRMIQQITDQPASLQIRLTQRTLPCLYKQIVQLPVRRKHKIHRGRYPKIYCRHCITRWLYCVECPQYSIRLEALAYLCASCLLRASTRPKIQGQVSRNSIVDRQVITAWVREWLILGLCALRCR